MQKQKYPCSFGEVTREMVCETRRDITSIKISMDKIDTKITDLFNHQSSRLPMWATTFISFLCTIVGALIVWISRS